MVQIIHYSQIAVCMLYVIQIMFFYNTVQTHILYCRIFSPMHLKVNLYFYSNTGERTLTVIYIIKAHLHFNLFFKTHLFCYTRRMCQKVYRYGAYLQVIIYHNVLMHQVFTVNNFGQDVMEVCSLCDIIYV